MSRAMGILDKVYSVRYSYWVATRGNNAAILAHSLKPRAMGIKEGGVYERV